MRGKKIARLTAAFVVTVAGCGGEAPPDVKHTPEVEKGPDGKCYETFGGNPPGQREVPCPAAPAAPTPTESDAPSSY